MSAAHLVVVDLQEIFATGPWAAPRFAATLPHVARLVAAFGPERTTFTRFVAPATPVGAWTEYYRRWSFALQPVDAPAYALVEPYVGTPTVDATTFGKWPALQATAAFAPGDELVVCGVSTDCCVLSTVLAAADAGMRMRVVEQACAGADDESHRKALDVMDLYAPLVRVVDTDDVLAAQRDPLARGVDAVGSWS